MSWCPVRRCVAVLLAEPGIVLVEPVVIWPNFSPFWSAEDAVGVIAVLPNAVELYGVLPIFVQVLLYDKNNTR